MAVARKTRVKPRRRRWWIVSLLILLLAAAGTWYFLKQQSPASTPEVSTGPQTMTAAPQTYRETVTGTGTLEPVKNLDMTFEVAGTLTSIEAVGARVLAGDVLAQLDTTSFERALKNAQFSLDQAKAKRDSTASSQSNSQSSLQENIKNAQLDVQDAERALATAKSNLDLAKNLQAVGSESADTVQSAQDSYDQAANNLSKATLSLQTLQESQNLQANSNEQDLRNADLAVESAQLSLEQAQEDLAAATLTAPFAGVIASVNANEGSQVSSNTAVLTLIDDSKVQLDAQIDETEISSVSLGLSAHVTLDAVPDTTFNGTVTTISPVAELVSNIPIFNVTITLDNAEGKMRPGMSAEAEILVQEVNNTITVPSRAIESVRDRHYIQVQQDDGSFKIHPVTLVATSGLNTIVQTDLPPGAIILLPDQESTQTTTSSSSQTRRPGLPFFGGRP